MIKITRKKKRAKAPLVQNENVKYVKKSVSQTSRARGNFTAKKTSCFESSQAVKIQDTWNLPMAF